ncbi:MAG: helix-turn-helix domain-containing protein, partial [Clostridia bacterium]|nr:helix-turn-helix domain-containing protein [Clostridia bacterium]
GCDQSMIVRWEKGECEPTATAIKKIAMAFNVSADYLLGLDDEEPKF